jgi:hypothetical protein
MSSRFLPLVFTATVLLAPLRSRATRLPSDTTPVGSVHGSLKRGAAGRRLGAVLTGVVNPYLRRQLRRVAVVTADGRAALGRAVQRLGRRVAGDVDDVPSSVQVRDLIAAQDRIDGAQSVVDAAFGPHMTTARHYGRLQNEVFTNRRDGYVPRHWEHYPPGHIFTEDTSLFGVWASPDSVRRLNEASAAAHRGRTVYDEAQAQSHEIYGQATAIEARGTPWQRSLAEQIRKESRSGQ